MRVEVRVELKPGILDAEAAAVEKSLALLGIGGVGSVSIAKVYTLDVGDRPPEEARRIAQRAVDRLLANPVIHRIRLTELSE